MRERTHKRKCMQVIEAIQDQRGLSLLEVLLSTVILGIALAGFLMALSTATTTSRLAIEEDELVYLASLEFESLRMADFEDVPFLLTSEAGYLAEVPDYFKDLAIISETSDGDVEAVCSGALDDPAGIHDSTLDYAFDGKRANFNSRWIGNTNALAYVDTGGDPIVGDPGGGGPIADGPGGDPDADGEFKPKEYQFIYYAFPEKTKISRILYDNRFNVTETMSAPPGDFDYLPHIDDIWQRQFQFFWSDQVLGFGDFFDPWLKPTTILKSVSDQGYGSSGIWVIYDNPDESLEAGIIGVQNIDTYTDYDTSFHWPYVSEIEVYGFNQAANYIEEYRNEDGEIQYNNVIMYFPNYLDSGLDLGRRVYVEASSEADSILSRKDLIWVVIEFFPSTNTNRAETWQKDQWWKLENSDELAHFQTCFYRDAPTRVDRLPNLDDFPVHLIYDNNEDILFPFTVPGASEIRAYFKTFDLEPGPGTDSVTIEDADGNDYIGPDGGNAYLNTWTPWVLGDTIVVHFQSNGSGNTYDMGYGGFEIGELEVRWVGVDSELP